MNILGISALYHDSAAALSVDGGIVAAAQEERFTRKKHDPNLPVHAANYCLSEAGISPAELKAIVYYDNPLLTLDRFLKNLSWLQGETDDLMEMGFEETFAKRLWMHEHVRDMLPGFQGEFLVCNHHISHAASAFYPSPFDCAAIVTVDGVGEWQTTTIALGSGRNIELLREINYPHSLGLFYSALSFFVVFG